MGCFKIDVDPTISSNTLFFVQMSVAFEVEFWGGV
jgi:hypothetical protein